jgi:hypothetical protein
MKQCPNCKKTIQHNDIFTEICTSCQQKEQLEQLAKGNGYCELCGNSMDSRKK